MAQHHRPQLSRLNILGPQSLNMQQPGMAFDPRGQSMYSPALPTSIQQGFHPPYPMNNHSALQTPMQPMFNPQPPGAPGRPSFAQHRGGQASIAQLAAAGIHPPNGMPMTPLGPGFPNQVPPGMSFGGPGPNFAHRNRRTPSMSLGGPPKAVLGGPNRKVSPLPPAAEVPPPVPVVKSKKVVVKFPQESVVEEGEVQSITHPVWARIPLLPADVPELLELTPPELSTAELFPADTERLKLPPTLDVFLPGKAAWDALKKLDIEEKLQKLGVEPGSGNSMPHIHAPHGRAASISSPADSALLYFKLNKLQQSQNTSSANSLSASPQPPFNLSSSPSNQLLPRMQNNRHGHSMSLAQPPTHLYTPPPAFNPFGPNATLGDSPGPLTVPLDNIHAPQGRVPVTAASLALSQSSSRPDSRPDFSRGFGLDVPEEEEEEPEEFTIADTEAAEQVDNLVETDDGAADELGSEDQVEEQRDGATTVSQSRLHSRHVSNALSLGSVGGIEQVLVGDPDMMRSSTPNGHLEFDDLDQDAIGEWTGSEDQNLSDVSEDEESIGEWSNPSDEERARQHRAQRRNTRRAKVDAARNLPKFPIPPATMHMSRAPTDDDMISNPSEEEHEQRQGTYLGVESGEYYTRPSSATSSIHNRPLPQPPHSRGASGQLSVSGYDPALAHSRTPSQPFAFHAKAPSLTHSLNGTASLNPNARPFVFGATSQSGSWAPDTFGGTSTPPASKQSNFSFGHSRAPSLGKPLNAGAQEFKPGGFTFRPPPAAPQIKFPPPTPDSRPLPAPPISQSPPRVVHGREKRQRRLSDASYDEEEDGDEKSNMNSSFKFPGDSPSSIRRSEPSSPRFIGSRRQSSLNAAAQPFTFSGFSSTLPFVPKESSSSLPHPLLPSMQDIAMGTPQTDNIELSPRDLHVPPSSTRQKRAPIPLDFKHPSHSNTVPAGLFKAHANGDERTRRTVRSRLGSREIFEHIHRPSLDDLAVPSISRKISRAQLLAESHSPNGSAAMDDFFSPAVQRRASLPDGRQQSILSSPTSGISMPSGNLTKRFEDQHLEQTLRELLDDKIDELRRDIVHLRSNGSTDARINEVISLFKTQLEKEALRGSQDGEADARGEIDFEVIRGVIQEGQQEAKALINQELAIAIQRLEEQARKQRGVPSDLVPLIQELNIRTTQAVIGAIQNTSLQQENIQANHLPSSFDHQSLIHELVSALGPIIASLQPETVDYDMLTNRLSQAVKPHISQLIDLASDKQETASLIVNRIIPMLPPPHVTPVLETEAIAAQLTSEIRRVIAPVDAHEIKEQVADLVVERLDSRLAVRDKAFNVDNLSGKITEGIVRSLEPMHQLASTMQALSEGQKAQTSQNDNMVSSQKEMAALLASLPTKLVSVKETVDAAMADLHKPQSSPYDTILRDAVSRLESTTENIVDGQKGISTHTGELLSLHQNVLGRLAALPEALSAATSVLQTAHADFSASQDASKQDLDEIKRLKTQNADIQVQLAKARGAHGQVRVEKDNLVEKVRAIEADRDHYLTQLEELRVSSSAQITASAAIEGRNAELEEALSKALERLKASDVVAQTNQERIVELESANRERTAESNSLKSKVDTLELQVTFVTRDKEAATKIQTLLQKENDRLSSQQTHWDDLHRTSEQITMLTSLIGQADNEEVRELKRIRDRSNKLEEEHTALQKRFKDQDSKVANSERVAVTARQSLTQAQQRASEWERRAKEHEGELEMTRTKLDQADQTQVQLEADYSLAKLQLEEREADDRLSKDRENNLRNQISTLEATVKRLESDLIKAKAAHVVPVYQNGHIPSPPRPDSRASTAYGVSRSGTPVARVNGSSVRSNTPPQTSVWDSMHAPRTIHTPRYPHLGPFTPNAKRLNYRAQAPSPTPSTVSLTPTQGDDGWWS